MVGYISTTQVLAATGFYDELDAAGAANQAVGFARGSALHKACHWLGMELEPAWASPHPELDGYLDGYRLFKREHNWRMTMHEAEFKCESLKLITHPDQIGHLDGEFADVELKSGAAPVWVNLQTAGQVIAMNEHLKVRRYCLSLPGDGKYKLIPHTDVRDFGEFRALVNACHVRAKYQGRFWESDNG
jgi:hypothetical protein